MVKARKSPTERESSGRINDKLDVSVSGSEDVPKARGRGRPKGIPGVGQKLKAKPAEPVTKMVDGKLMKRAVGVPRKVKTGKRGRPRKEYVWVEANEES